MKKVLAFVLAVVLVMGIAVPAAANGAAGKTEGSALPELAGEYGNVRLHNQGDLQDLPEEKQEAMADAEEALKAVDAKGLALRYFLYTEILSGESTVSLTFEPIPHNEILFMQYINGMWVAAEHSVGEDGTITVPANVDAPLAIFMESVSSPGATLVNLIPVLTDESYLAVQLHTMEQIATLSEEIQNRMADAKEALKAACPEGFTVKYFFEMEIIGTEGAVDVGFEFIDHTEIAFMQFVDGEWTELEYTIENSGVITVFGLVDGPVAVFVK